VNIHVKAALTLVTLVSLVLIGVAWGWSAMTTSFPHSSTPPVCIRTTLHHGDHVSPPKVTVSVFNASQRVGLAERTMSQFEAQGFAPGKVGNAPHGTDVAFAQVWTNQPANPAVRLVVSRLGHGAHVVHKQHRGPGVTVIVGRMFGKLVGGMESVRVTSSATICEPPTD
jgi:hypothetical protein